MCVQKNGNAGERNEGKSSQASFSVRFLRDEIEKDWERSGQKYIKMWNTRRSARSEKYCPKVSGRISSHLSDLDFRQIGKSFTPWPLSATIYFFTNTHIDKIIVHNCTHIDNICTWSCTWYLISLSLPLLYFLKDIWGWCFFWQFQFIHCATTI